MGWGFIRQPCRGGQPQWGDFLHMYRHRQQTTAPPVAPLQDNNTHIACFMCPTTPHIPARASLQKRGSGWGLGDCSREVLKRTKGCLGLVILLLPSRAAMNSWSDPPCCLMVGLASQPTKREQRSNNKQTHIRDEFCTVGGPW